MSNLLSIPLVHIVAQTGNNEDWVDSLLYLVDPVLGTQLDLRGINFEMEVRRQPTDHEVVIHASTSGGTLVIGTPPQYGYLIIQIPLTTMAQLPGTYFADIRGSDDQSTRVIATISLTIFEGITR
jgi:hypothetical protein